jgi:hypothetical protein
MKFATKQQQQIDILKMLDERIAQQEASEKEKLISTNS